MKNIEITGKHQVDKIKKANDPNNPNIIAERDCMQKLSDFVFENRFQVQIINKLYLNLDHKDHKDHKDLDHKDHKDLDHKDLEIEYKKELLKEINKKIISYKTQDVNKNKYDDNNITQEETIEKLVASKLKCYYCKCNMKIFYKKVRDVEQWTLDRIDNDLPHQDNNVIVACLKCNLQRRRQSKDKFLFTKQLKIIKNN